jgi:UDP-N-acetylmuramyl pentapeptide phosphotransferase/UDP-N-acetylglucosamine-1-phosphate transferase
VSLVALVGWIDDRRSLSPWLRLTAHATASLLLIPLILHHRPIVIASAVWVLVVLIWALTAINVVNFMDGIDGLIAGQIAIFGVHLALLARESDALGHALVVVGVCSGFLIWNRPRAQVFLGDVGSGALGIIAVVCAAKVAAHDVPLTVLPLPLLPMYLDASTTLLRRAYRRERLTKAHRLHLYQRLANEAWGHGRVSLLYAGVAAVGIVPAIVPENLRTESISLYVLGVGIAGYVLDRLVPLPPGAPRLTKHTD